MLLRCRSDLDALAEQVRRGRDADAVGRNPVNEADYPTKVLPYGKSVSYEGVTCVATSDGVTCIETASGHGFSISRSANDIF